MIGTGRISGVQLIVTAGARKIETVKAFSRGVEGREAFARHYSQSIRPLLQPQHQPAATARATTSSYSQSDSHQQ